MGGGYKDGRKKGERTRGGWWRKRKAGERVEKDNREGENKEHPVKVLSVNGTVMWHSAQCEISTSLNYNDWGKGEFTQRHNAALSRSRVMDFLH